MEREERENKDKRENKRRASARLQVSSSSLVKKREKQTTPIYLGSNEETQVSNKDVVSTSNTKDIMPERKQMLIESVRSKQPNKGAPKSKDKEKYEEKQSDSKNSDGVASLNNESSGEGGSSGTKSKNDAPPTKEPRNFEGERFLTEKFFNFPAIPRNHEYYTIDAIRFGPKKIQDVADARSFAAQARKIATSARAAASDARDAASIALCSGDAGAAARAVEAADAADAADAAAAAAAQAADAVDIAADRVAAITLTEAMDDSEALCTLYNYPSGYYAALRTATFNLSDAECDAQRKGDAAYMAATIARRAVFLASIDAKNKP